MAKRDVAELEAVALKSSFSRPTVHLWAMLIFLMLIGFVAAILLKIIETAFTSNPFLNGVIIAALVIGIVNAFRQILMLYPEIRWVNGLRIADPGIAPQRSPVLLAPMANMIRDRRGVLSLSTTSMRTIVDSVGARLDERRDTSRYLVGLLVFLGLLGTFFGLLETIQSVGATIRSLDVTTSDSLNVFQELKTGLEAPLKGMGTAFSSSLFGLSGSLILGFLDLQTSQAQNRFYNDLEEWLSGITELTPGTSAEGSTQMRYSFAELQRTLAELSDRLASGVAGDGAGEAVKQLTAGLDKLVKQVRDEQKVVREWVDEQAALLHELSGTLREIAAGSQHQRDLNLTLRELSSLVRDLSSGARVQPPVRR